MTDTTRIATLTVLTLALLVPAACSGVDFSEGAGTVLEVGDRYLETLDDRCERKTVRVIGKAGDVLVRAGETKSFHVPSGQLVWFCEEGSRSDRETSKCKGDTNIVQLTRGATGSMTWVCYERG